MFFFFFKQKTAYEISACLVGSEMCIRDRSKYIEMRILSRFRKFLDAMKDQKLNREFVGVDRFGNKYYQYYSHYGLPTRREIEPVQKKRAKFFKDTAFHFWMNSTDQLPPTENQLRE
eukprot:TRINITY_DN11430_c0_g1_i7.p1 TRINITY_DN11430_c0_g1~~TRINITY_DN11430_c0_g1_i7.p1  ORF type:complete len:117 (+),score=25.39 TRINITY_DN11430_c0_g1_i7:28-378(+)